MTSSIEGQPQFSKQFRTLVESIAVDRRTLPSPAKTLTIKLGPLLDSQKPRGITALFTGPSGTGKTRATQAIAHQLHLPLFRVDLGKLNSKYIGETEKNLSALHDTASQHPMILLFDEADALFGKRTSISDRNDRYANMEVSYLYTTHGKAYGHEHSAQQAPPAHRYRSTGTL